MGLVPAGVFFLRKYGMREFINIVEGVLTELSRPHEMEDAEEILNKGGWHAVGAGYWGAVYGKEGVDYVLKLFDNRDRGYREFLSLIQLHPNPHFPVIKGKPIRVTPMYWAVRMEKLLPASGAPHLGVYLIGRKNGGPHPGNEPQVAAHHATMIYLEHHPELKKALDLIYDNLLSTDPVTGLIKHREDLHGENVMKRANGTLVIIDPVAT